MDTPVQQQKTIHVQVTAIHCRLAIQLQPKTYRNEEITGMYITINAIESYPDIPGCMTAEEIREVTLQYEHLSNLAKFIICIWPSTKTEGLKELQPYWSSLDEIAVIDGIAIAGRRTIIPIATTY